MRVTDVLAILTSVLFGGITGWLLGGMTAGLVGAFASGALALVGVRARIRPAVVVTVLVGAMTGGLIGANVVHAICLPATCRSLEVVGGVISAVLSFIGVGLVAALVTRSFDEYNEQIAADRPPD